MTYERKKLEELDLIDNFLFGSVMTHPVYGPYVGRVILEKMLQRKLGELVVVPQKVYYGSDTHLHGIRLDVQLEEKLDATTVYDVEPELDGSLEAIKALPRRVRFYHAKMSSRGLKAGEKYGALKNEVIIIITPFDPFGLNRMLYTVKNCCVEEPDMPYDDGALTLYFYTKGEVGIPSDEIKQLLAYMEDSSEENATSTFLQELHSMIEHVKHDEEVSIRYMRLWEDERDILERGRQIGRAEGHEKGREEGREEGIKAFVLDNREENIPKERIVEKLIKRFALSQDEAEVCYNKYSV